MDLSPEQADIVAAPLGPLSVLACAGSGKTRTAVLRLAELRAKILGNRRHVALLSFSNVAVNAFKSQFAALLRARRDLSSTARVTIETVDAFITNSIIRPHAYRTMGSARTPFLLSGREPFLENPKFRFWVRFPKSTAARPVPVKDISVFFVDGVPGFWYAPPNGQPLRVENGHAAAQALAKIGAYSHEIGAYWAYRTLREQPAVLRALSHRYPHILVDEAQDIGQVHQAILQLLASCHTALSLIGDPCQAIYE
ncbi:MAG: UvrD-helicase domain-containing protein [Polyangiaceae bacterium]